jgi:integrase
MGDGQLIVGPPKTAAGRRVVAPPPGLVDDLRRHLTEFVAPEPAALIFVGPKGAALRRSNFQKHWSCAVTAAGLDERGLHFHDLRHTGNTLTAQSGAMLSDLMARMGHASSRAASIYLHTTSERDVAVAAALDRFLPPRPSGT